MTCDGFSRRTILAGLGASLALPASAPFAAEALRPRLRTAGPATAASVPGAGDLIAAAGLGGKVAYAVADARTGELLETHAHLSAMPPASVTKAATALYALDHLGAGYRYKTRLIATGPVVSGRLEGDLVLQASGDPTLDSDNLGTMAEALKKVGIATIQGRFLVALPPFAEVGEIDPGQPYQVWYNPGVAGLNLNLNRVHFEWKREGKGHSFTMEARAARFRPASGTSTMKIVDRDAPVYEFERSGGIDRWSVARPALGSKGARWLPVRAPVDYTLDALATIVRSYGIELPRPVRVAQAPEGLTVCEIVSPPMHDILQAMLKDSINLTAEAVGQTASVAAGVRPQTLADSAGAMSQWLASVSSAQGPGFVDHSGLGPRNDITPRDMVAALSYAGPAGALSKLLKPWYFRTAKGGIDRGNPVRMVAKTGTLNFVSGLAGFILPPGGRALVFAIFAADEPRREALSREQLERPPGGKSWSSRSRKMDDALLKRWTSLYT